ncbi:MAG: extracellular solute-binding protein [Epulopiscium sp.]|nr:extracellular solute-binding protein [Candidatus Epulonipiscium sp.]
MKKNKLFTLLAMILVTILLFTACGEKQKTDTPTTAAPDKKTNTPVAASKDTDATIDPLTHVFKNKIKLKIPVYDRGVQGLPDVSNNYWTQWIQSEFGDKHNIDVEYVAIPRASTTDKFNMLLAANDEPTVIFDYDFPVMMQFYKRGVFKPLSEELLNTWAPDYMEYTKEVSSFGIIENQHMFLMGDRPAYDTWTTLVRQDWLDKVNMEMPKSLDEYNKMLAAFKEANLGKSYTVPATISLPTSGYVAGNFAFRPFPLEEKDNALYGGLTIASLTWEPTYEMLKMTNKQYNEGLLSPEFALDTDGAQARADFLNGNAGVYGCYLNADILNTLLANDPDAKLAILDPYAGVPEGGVPATRLYQPYGMMSGIAYSATDDETAAALMFFNWMAQPDILYTMQYGIKDLTYEVDADGIANMKPYEGTERLNFNNNADMWCIVTTRQLQATHEDTLKAIATASTIPGYEYLITDAYDYTQSIAEYSYMDYTFLEAIASEATYNATLLSKWQEYYTKLVMCKPEEFDKLYKEACDDYLASGYQAILDERSKVYDATK